MAGSSDSGGTPKVPPLRRRDREMRNREEADALIERSRVCRLALAEGDRPYVVPMNFAYDGTCVFLHSAPAGRKLEMLGKNPAVCLEFDECLEIVPGAKACDTACRYNSVLAFGVAELIEDPEEKNAALKLITRRYTARDCDFDARELASVAVIKIRLDALSGKSSLRG